MESILPNPNTKNSAKVSEIIYLKHSCSFRWLTPKAFTNSSPGQRPGKLRSEVNGTLKEFAKSPCVFFGLSPQPFQGWYKSMSTLPRVARYCAQPWAGGGKRLRR